MEICYLKVIVVIMLSVELALTGEHFWIATVEMGT